MFAAIHTENYCIITLLAAKVQIGEVLLILWTQGRTKPSAIALIYLLPKVQHVDGDNSEYPLCSGKQPTFSGVLMSAFAAIRCSTTGRWPFSQATYSGVAPV